MEEELEALGKFIKSKQMISFFILAAIAAILFYPILSRKQRKALELQESIKESNKSGLKSFGGASLERVE
jgi:preprotein translocase subunit YajC